MFHGYYTIIFALITNDIQSKIGIRWHQKFMMFESLNQSTLTCKYAEFSIVVNETLPFAFVLIDAIARC